MKTAIFRYQCRNCGQFCLGASTSPENAELVLLCVVAGDPDLTRLPLPGKEMFSLTILHSCGVKGRGLADLVGFVMEDR